MLKLFLLLVLVASFGVSASRDVLKEFKPKYSVEPRFPKALAQNPDLSDLKAYPMVPTASGDVRGFSLDSVNYFLGIPFATPPTGPNRFKPPQAAQPWNTTRDCFSHGQICSQLHVAGDILLGGEDCLYMNIHTPAGFDPSKDAPLPVYFWIYGGGYVFGDGYEFGFYDPSNLVRKHNVIVVSHNYRLGALGFLSHPLLMAESQTTGNFGVQDQQLALQWVHQNIANFGGDTSRILLFGESAGAFSVCWHLVNKISNGLFSSAIMESGTCDNDMFFQPKENSFSFGDMYANAIGCNSTVLQPAEFLSCLRGLKVEDVVGSVASWLNPNWPNNNGEAPTGWIPGSAPVMPWGPAIDGTAAGLEDIPLNIMKNGDSAKVPLIIGTNQNEGDIFVPMMPLVDKGISWPLANASVAKLLSHWFNASTVTQIIELYPVENFDGIPDNMVSRILRDFIFVCSSRRVARARTAHGLPTYVYHFVYKGDWIEDPFLGDYHSSELEYVWDNQWPPLVHIFSERDQAMADTFGSFWYNQAVYGNPNGANNATGAWPAWSSAGEKNILMDVPTGVQEQYAEGPCDFWDTVMDSPQN